LQIEQYLKNYTKKKSGVGVEVEKCQGHEVQRKNFKMLYSRFLLFLLMLRQPPMAKAAHSSLAT